MHAPFLKYFREVANCGSVRMAARHLHISSSAVNRQILKVEEELGISLFHRTASGMTLSPAGRILAEHVNRTLSEADRCLDEIATLAGQTRAPLTIAGQESVIAEFLPPVLVQLHASYPQAGSSFKAAGGHDLNRLLHEHAADVAIIFDAEPNAGTDMLMRRQLPVGAIVSQAHPFAKRKQLSIMECAEYPLILPDQSWPLRRILDEMLQQLSIEPNVLTTSNSVEFLHTMINQQMGIGFQTPVGIEKRLQTGELVMIPLCNPEPLHQQLCLCVSTSHRKSDVFQFLLTLLLDRLGSYADEWA
ncbi:LysR family transcriptional regulator [Granulosicoccus antarcticus]|uniref:HTH-type transcriptional regulator CynR n=1 Tax=Granulosicoccus antarcticus IMCC3135 TaxID=1192854 RepID=A0A2Z2NN04_9GAMM|nr:LysR family transcriptional regulator [Granulosicoccus antarcticus]ASJ71108.1 HTH-type transcriptional regulator CynR [Granulosicoccus antarcticus IMCC3135]